jgi:hypothetical protein
MEGMICTRMCQIQSKYHHQERTLISPDRWARGLILKLLEATHGQWIYRNVQIYDEVAGTRTTQKKEDRQRDIEEQMDMGKAGLLEEDHCWMMEVNLGDMENLSGEWEEYWLLVICAAWEAATLTRQRTRQDQEESVTDGH